MPNIGGSGPYDVLDEAVLVRLPVDGEAERPVGA